MKAKDKPRFVKEARELYSSLDVQLFETDPRNRNQIDKINRLIAILTNFSANDGQELKRLLQEYQKWRRRSTSVGTIRNRIDDLLQFIGQKIEEMDLYVIEDEIREKKEKIIKKLKNDEFRVQSNLEGEDEHLFIYDRNEHSGDHVHLVIDGQTGEVRIDPKDKPPHDLLEKVTTITTRSGIKIRSTKTTLEFLEGDSGKSNIKPLTTFEINETKPVTWAHQGTGFNTVWGLALTLKINNFKNECPDYIKVKLIGNTNDGPWESQHFIFQETKERMDKPDEPFEIPPHKITEIGVVLSQELPEHSSSSRHLVPKPDFDTDTVVLVISTESGILQEIKIKPRLISGA